MKNLFSLIFLTLIASAIYSCKKNEDTAHIGKSLPPSPSSNAETDAKNRALLLGKWYEIADTVREYKNGKLVRTSHPIVTPGDYQAFTPDGYWTEVLRGNSSQRQIKYTLKGNIIKMDHEAYTNGGITEPAYSKNTYIKTLNATTLINFVNDTILYANGDVYVVYEIFHSKR
ncbi:hypothetical protein [Mucilaginibacter myungsuensis]|uniref:Uncharacterized protein n=1 Tax=Mucilaginibacter myungsuensis TaxID=649104 RepID=A0A929PVP2_9SPHI|nr:hypothetical protein [Mucilaginibacter myungsuensis]MBE9661983.1 hypothetical protein [Mucilaginibacter myungsuensis]MDN3599584.1 hypothetical protein [Mucilaginibacter myungsuensis]